METVLPDPIVPPSIINIFNIPEAVRVSYICHLIDGTKTLRKKYKNKTILVEEYLPPYSYYYKGKFICVNTGHFVADHLYIFDGVDTLTKIDIKLPFVPGEHFPSRKIYPPFVGQEVYLPEPLKEEAYKYSLYEDIRLSKPHLVEDLYKFLDVYKRHIYKTEG
jgi:hypothetical protein